MKLEIKLSIIGLIIGLLIGEFIPGVFTNGLDSLASQFQGPFSELRNMLALRFGFFGALIGLFIGFIANKSISNKEKQ